MSNQFIVNGYLQTSFYGKKTYDKPYKRVISVSATTVSKVYDFLSTLTEKGKSLGFNVHYDKSELSILVSIEFDTYSRSVLERLLTEELKPLYECSNKIHQTTILYEGEFQISVKDEGDFVYYPDERYYLLDKTLHFSLRKDGDLTLKPILEEGVNPTRYSELLNKRINLLEGNQSFVAIKGYTENVFGEVYGENVVSICRERWNECCSRYYKRRKIVLRFWTR